MLKQPIKVYPVNYEDGLKRGLKQGYAKALDDITKIIDNEIKSNKDVGKMLHTCQGRAENDEGNSCLVCFEDNVLKIIKQEIAKLEKT